MPGSGPAWATSCQTASSGPCQPQRSANQAKASRMPTTQRRRRIRATFTDAQAEMNNSQLFERAQKVIPGGVNSPVRAFRAVGGTPRFISRADGAYMFDAEGKRY